jgi:hypothetical protein
MPTANFYVSYPPPPALVPFMSSSNSLYGAGRPARELIRFPIDHLYQRKLRSSNIIELRKLLQQPQTPITVINRTVLISHYQLPDDVAFSVCSFLVLAVPPFSHLRLEHGVNT